MSEMYIMNRIPRRYLSAIISILGVVILAAPILHLESQTLFEWPENNFDVSEYKYFDKCFAASSRVRDSLYRKDAILADTLRWKDQTSLITSPKRVVDIAQRCIEEMNSGAIAPEQYWIAMELYLLTQKYNIVDQMINNRLNNIPAADTLHRVWFLDSVINRYAQTRPRLIDVADKYAVQVSDLKDAIPLIPRVKVNWTLFQVADSLQNKDAIAKYAERILEIISNSDRSALNSEEVRAINIVTIAVTRRLFHVELLDSLRKSTESYATTLHESLYKILQEKVNTKTGEKLPALEGDFWFPAGAEKNSYPQSGKISLIYFINAREAVGARSLSEFAVLRRLQSRFPALDVLLVATTKGYFGSLEPPVPEAEAKLINDLVKNLYKLPGTLTVTDRPIIPIEDPDGRILSQIIPNALNYPGELNSPKFGKYYLADESGLLVSNEGISALEEDRLSDLIQALIDRNSKASR